jgi:hypothetical protein
MRAPADRVNDEDGTIVLFVLGLCVVVLFIGGLSLDLWRGFSERRELAAIVDGAAVAAASAIDEAAYRADGTLILAPALAAEVACEYLRAHADPFPGCWGIEAGPGGVEVRAQREVPLTLFRVLAPREPPLVIDVTARAEPHRAP